MSTIIDSLNGIDASRRVGWARYYSAQEEIESLRGVLEELANAVIFDPRVRNGDPILALAKRALSA